jgi:hypothetical protein
MKTARELQEDNYWRGQTQQLHSAKHYKNDKCMFLVNALPVGLKIYPE